MSQAVIALQRYNFLRTQNPKTNEKMNNAPNGSYYATAFGQMRQQPASAICPQAKLTVPKAAARAMHIYIMCMASEPDAMAAAWHVGLETGRLALQYGPFQLAKRQISQCKTAYFANHWQSAC